MLVTRAIALTSKHQACTLLTGAVRKVRASGYATHENVGPVRLSLAGRRILVYSSEGFKDDTSAARGRQGPQTPLHQNLSQRKQRINNCPARHILLMTLEQADGYVNGHTT
jgi:hypothetical protein